LGSTSEQKPLRRLWGNAIIRWLIRIAVIAGVAWCTAVALIYYRQESLLFRPRTLPPEHVFALRDVREVVVPVNGAELSALHYAQPEARGVVFFLHGNAGNLANWLTSTRFYERTGFDLFMIDYRGFGKSTGRIEREDQLHADVLAAWRMIAPRYAGKRVVFYGRSLGTGLATRLATEYRPDLLVLVSPYRSVASLASEIYPWVPPAILRYPLRTDTWLPTVQAPILVLHGDSDRLIKIKHGQDLAQLNPRARFVPILGAGHNDIHRFDSYTQALEAALAKL
jgi:uncharacterized protein